MDIKKKQAAAIAAVTLYLKAEQEAFSRQAQAAAVMGQAASAPAGPLKVWGLSGRQAQMQMRSMMQMKTFK